VEQSNAVPCFGPISNAQFHVTASLSRKLTVVYVLHDNWPNCLFPITDFLPFFFVTNFWVLKRENFHGKNKKKADCAEFVVEILTRLVVFRYNRVK
jgi:hypothetical protein